MRLLARCSHCGRKVVLEDDGTIHLIDRVLNIDEEVTKVSPGMINDRWTLLPVTTETLIDKLIDLGRTEIEIERDA